MLQQLLHSALGCCDAQIGNCYIIRPKSHLVQPLLSICGSPNMPQSRTWYRRPLPGGMAKASPRSAFWMPPEGPLRSSQVSPLKNTSVFNTSECGDSIFTSMIAVSNILRPLPYLMVTNYIFAMDFVREVLLLVVLEPIGVFCWIVLSDEKVRGGNF